MTQRNAPYGAFNIIINFDGGEVLGGFSEVSGIGSGSTMSDERQGNTIDNQDRTIADNNNVRRISLKRGIVNSRSLWDWIQATRCGGATAQRSVTIALLDEGHSVAQSWRLKGAVPILCTGPTPAGQSGGDVAMEELVLATQALEINA
jgi:phage tail-like protein